MPDLHTHLSPPRPPAVTWKLADLKEHPLQAATFGDTAPVELDELAADIEANGLREPPVILPDGTVVCGHRRLAAARLLGWSELLVVVDHELAARGPEAVERRLIEDNLHRRHLDELSIARCCKRLMELERSGAGRPSPQPDGQLRDRIGARFGLSGRSISRYLRALAAPVEVQHAVSAGHLKLGDAVAVAGLPPAVRSQIAAEIRQGDDPVAVVSRRTAPKSGRHRTVGDAGAAFVRNLRRGLDDLEGRVGQVARLGEQEVATLEKAQGVIGQLLAQACAWAEESHAFDRLNDELADDEAWPDPDVRSDSEVTHKGR